MNSSEDPLNEIDEKLAALQKAQKEISKEISSLEWKVYNLKLKRKFEKEDNPISSLSSEKATEPSKTEKTEVSAPFEKDPNPSTSVTPIKEDTSPRKAPFALKSKSEMESYIGKNVFSKLGILILVIGVAIGTKYSIENNLINPLTRVILGYVQGIVLLGVGIKLEKKYRDYSAILVSGSLVIMYIITFTAFSFYELIPQSLAFVLMLLFTSCSVISALYYDKQFIAHFGMVGAYAIPFLLSNENGNIPVLFSYVAIINIGILFIAFKKEWKLLYFSSFFFTWAIFLSWFIFDYEESDQGLAFLFVSIYFVTFYAMMLAYMIKTKAQLKLEDILVFILNSVIFYGVGIQILDTESNGNTYFGLFTLANAFIHFGVFLFLNRKEKVNPKVLYLIATAVITFVTLTIPVELDGNWVTLIWVIEAVLLYGFGTKKNFPQMEYLSYIVMVLALGSLVQDWQVYEENNIEATHLGSLTPFFNTYFLTSLCTTLGFGIIYKIYLDHSISSPSDDKFKTDKKLHFIFPIILLILSYFSFYLEIQYYWNVKIHLISNALEDMNYGNYYRVQKYISFKEISLILYSLLYASVLAGLNLTRFKNKELGFLNLVLLVFFIFQYLTIGLYNLSDLRDIYLNYDLEEGGISLALYLGLRYLSYLFVAMAIYAVYRYQKVEFMHIDSRVIFYTGLSIIVLWIASSELISWMDLNYSEEPYKFGITILWALYSLFLIILGFIKKQQYIRILGIILFGITLIKVFFYDIYDFDTITKTILFITIGILLLTASYLYNKYKNRIEDDTPS